jgi:hypothetical protein
MAIIPKRERRLLLGDEEKGLTLFIQLLLRRYEAQPAIFCMYTTAYKFFGDGAIWHYLRYCSR